MRACVLSGPPRSGEPGEWLQISLEGLKEVRAIQLNYYEHRAVQHNKAMDLYHQYRIYHSIDGQKLGIGSR